MPYFILTIITHLVLTVFLFVLTREYPAASLLRSVFIIYEMIYLILWLYGKKRDYAETQTKSMYDKAYAAIPFHSLKEPKPIQNKPSTAISAHSLRKPERATLLVAATDVYGLADGGESYLLFNLFCCMDVAAMCASVAAADEALADVYLTLQEEYAQWLEPADYEATTVAASHIELVSNPTGILSKEPVVFYTITELMMEAEESVDFHTPYIICNSWMLDRLESICDAVGDVTMMTNSIANNGNPFGASDYLVNKENILATGVQILEYDGGISYHGKCFVIDDRLCAIGSFNWDMRSTYIDTELMLVIDSEELNAILREEMESYEESALTVLDTDTSIVPDGMQAQEVRSGKMVLLRIVNLFYWIRFLM